VRGVEYSDSFVVVDVSISAGHWAFSSGAMPESLSEQATVDAIVYCIVSYNFISFVNVHPHP
jgi:hypothetical protein